MEVGESGRYRGQIVMLTEDEFSYPALVVRQTISTDYCVEALRGPYGGKDLKGVSQHSCSRRG
jgi:hypothetical protein